MWPDLINMLSPWQWAVLAMVPPAITLLYFLKLKRRPLEVPSTYLWHRSIEDLHVNTIWQRLRRNLLLFLQLLLVFLAMLAVLRPGWKGAKLTGDRFIFLIDNSASMQATDVETSRLEEAKRSAHQVIDLMKPHDVGMIVSFADTARVEQMFTENRRQLNRSLDRIQPTQRPTSLGEALNVASGLANPGRSADDPTDVQVAEPMPATMFIFSDGKFAETTTSLGNLDPVYKPIGTTDAANVGIVVFNVRRNEAKPNQLQAFARLQNFGVRQASVSLELWLDDQIIDAAEFQIDASETQGFQRDLGLIDSGILNLRIGTDDDFALDDQAWTVVNRPRRAKVLLVTPVNKPLTLALTTELSQELAEVTIETPDFLEDEKGPYRQQAATGAYDLVIYDRCRPKVMPQANTLFIGTLPPLEVERPAAGGTGGSPPVKETLWKAGAEVNLPGIIDIDPAHPLTQWLAMDDVLIARATPLEVPPGGAGLIHSTRGPLLAVAPREGFEDAVLGFVFIDEVVADDGTVETYFGTNWWIRASFPAFVLNVLHYLGGGRMGSGVVDARPGKPVKLESPLPDKPLEVRTPSGETIKLPAAKLGKFNFTGTEALGVYEVRLAGKPLEQFAVNLFQASESDIRTRPDIEVGRVQVEGRSASWEDARRELWKYLLLAGLAVLFLEWYIFHRRVYL